MDACEAAKVVFSRIQSLDPDNAASIMGLLLMQDHGEKDMIRLAFGPESLVRSTVLKARKDLGLLSVPSSPCPLLSNESSSTSPSTWVASSSLFSRSSNLDVEDSVDPEGAAFYSDVGSEFSSSGLSWGTSELGWKQCLYFARGYCKNGSACRFLHCPEIAAGDGGAQQQFHEQLLSSNCSNRVNGSQLMASAASFMPSPSSSKSLSFLLLQKQQHDSQSSAAAMMLSADEQLKYLSRSRVDMLLNPGSRQIYLTFPADSTFREEDVSQYFSIYGPVQDVRIPYQQKRMFGFVTFVYPETVKLILAKGNPHFVCNSRVLVKPYKEKGKVYEKKYQQQQLLMERCNLSGCSTPTGLDCRDPYDLQQLGVRVAFNNKELLLGRSMEDQQMSSIDLEHAIELQRHRFTGLQLIDSKMRSLSSPVSLSDTINVATSNSAVNIVSSGFEGNASGGTAPAGVPSKVGSDLNGSEHKTQEVQQDVVNSAYAAAKKDKDATVSEGIPNEDNHCQERIMEHNLPDSPFASPTKLSLIDNSFFTTAPDVTDMMVSPHRRNSNRLAALSIFAPSLEVTSSESCSVPVPRFSSHQQTLNKGAGVHFL